MARARDRWTQYLSPFSLISKAASWVSYFAIAAMMAFVFYDVIARYFGHPTSGSNDVVQLLTLIAVAFTMSFTQVLKRHPSTSFIVERFSPKAQQILGVITGFLSIVPFVLLVWTSYSLAQHFWNTHEGTMTLGIPIYPMIYCIALGSALMCLVLIANFVESVRKAVTK